MESDRNRGLAWKLVGVACVLLGSGCNNDDSPGASASGTDSDEGTATDTATTEQIAARRSVRMFTVLFSTETLLG